MSLVKMNWHPGPKELRTFGRVALFMLPLIFLLLSWLKGLTLFWVLIGCAVGVLIYLLSLISTQLIKPIFIVLQLLTLPIGLIVSYAVMGIFYYLVLTPVGIFFRFLRRDPLHRKFEPEINSYWVPHHPPGSAKRYFNQF